MAVTVTLPELGESVVEGTIARWLVKEGESVERDQPIVEVTTDKVDAEIPSPASGVLEKILVPEGETVEVGAELARIDDSEGAAAGSAKKAKQAGSDGGGEARRDDAEPASARGEDGEEPEPSQPAEASDEARPAEEEEEERPAPRRRESREGREERGARAESGEARSGAEGEVRASPAALRIAEEQGIDLREIEGSGPSGRVMKNDLPPSGEPPRVRDLESARRERAEREAPRPAREEGEERAEREAPRAPRPTRSAPSTDFEDARARFGQYHLQEGDRVIPMSALRRLVAEHMVYSKHVSPHVGTVAEVDLGGVVSFRARQKRDFQAAHGFGLTYLPFIVHATVRALREQPELNASVIEDAIVEKRDIHVGIAVETEKGLVVPVVRHADRLSLAGLAEAIEDLSSRARRKRLSADELKGGTFTVSNPGRTGNLYGFAIINQPQVGILRMGEIVKRPVVRSLDGEDAIVIRPVMHLALSYDHRAVDGAPANAFLHRVRELLEEADFDL